MKVIGYVLIGLYLLGLTGYAAWTGELPGRNGSGSVTVTEEPSLFWFGIAGYSCIGLGMIWHAIFRR